MKLQYAFIALMMISCTAKTPSQEVEIKESIPRSEVIEELTLFFDEVDKQPGRFDFPYHHDLQSALQSLGAINLSSVKELNLYGTHLESIEGIERFDNLQAFYLNGTRVRNIDVLQELEYLEEITAAYNQIRSIPDLASLKNLKRANFHNNPLVDFANIKNLVQCQVIQFSYYPESDKEAENKAREISDYLESLGIRCHWNGYQAQKTDD